MTLARSSDIRAGVLIPVVCVSKEAYGSVSRRNS